MRIYFLHNSAVCIFIKKTLLIFDYFADRRGSISNGHISEDDIKKAEHVYVFASHSHSDHFNKCIFKWAKYNKNTTYILDSTIKEISPNADAVFLSRGEKYEDEGLSVEEFGSTDIGGSFYVRCEGKSFFHAGDLNNWHWKDEGDKRYSRVMEKYYLRELRFIRHSIKEIDYAFFPVDKRMGSDFDEGADVFIETMKPKHFVPIHFMNFEDTEQYRQKQSGSSTKVFAIQKNGDRLE